MTYETFEPCDELKALVKYYWTLEVPFDPANERQKLIPDGCIEMTFNFADGIKKYLSEDEFVVHPPAMVMGQRTLSYDIEPIGHVDSFAVCFYPLGFANFVNTPLHELVNKEVPIGNLFGKTPAKDLEQRMVTASNTRQRIQIIELFLLKKLHETNTIENIVRTTVEALVSTKGSSSIHAILKEDVSKRRQLERHFKKQIGISPKQLGKVIRLQTALNLLLNKSESLTNIAYESEYFDQAHFIKDFREFTGVSPKEFLGNENMKLSSLFYK